MAVTTSRLATQGALDDPVVQAFTILRVGFTVAPILFGLDKFLNWMVDWEIYLAPGIDDIVPGTAHQAMLAVGVIEVVAGLVVALRPKFGRLTPEVAKVVLRLPRGRLAGSHHREPAHPGRVLRHRPARLRSPARCAGARPPGHRRGASTRRGGIASVLTPTRSVEGGP